MYRILAIDPGNSSTKIGLFEDKKPVMSDSIRHDVSKLKKFASFMDQLEFRFNAIDSFISKNNINISGIDYFIGRGGYLKPLKSGLYEVNEKMIRDLKNSIIDHSSNLGALIAYDFATKNNKKAFILDPVCVDELSDIAKISGHPKFPRRSAFHALNQKRMARRASIELGRNYQDLNLIVVMLGSGISVGIHSKGSVIDVTNAVEGEGPFTPERSGAIPIMPFVKYILDNKLDYSKAYKMIYGNGGISAYLGTSDMYEVIDRFKEGQDKKVRLVIEAMIYQVAKEIAAMSVSVNGNIDAIIITGGLANEEMVVDMIKKRIGFITGTILVYPGEDELAAMAEGVAGAIKGEIEIINYN